MEFVGPPVSQTSPSPYNALPLETAPAALEAALEGSEMWVEEEARRRKGTPTWLPFWVKSHTRVTSRQPGTAVQQATESSFYL